MSKDAIVSPLSDLNALQTMYLVTMDKASLPKLFHINSGLSANNCESGSVADEECRLAHNVVKFESMG